MKFCPPIMFWAMWLLVPRFAAQYKSLHICVDDKSYTNQFALNSLLACLCAQPKISYHTQDEATSFSLEVDVSANIIMSAAMNEFLQTGVERVDPANISIEDRTCDICYGSYGDDETPSNITVVPIRIRTCRHIFCRDCISQHVRTQHPNANTCPKCRGVLFQRDRAPVNGARSRATAVQTSRQAQAAIAQFAADSMANEARLRELGTIVQELQESLDNNMRELIELAETIGVELPDRELYADIDAWFDEMDDDGEDVEELETDDEADAEPAAVVEDDGPEVVEDESADDGIESEDDEMEDFEEEVDSDQDSSSDYEEDSDEEML